MRDQFSDPVIAAIAARIQAETGLAFPSGQRTGAEARIQRVIQLGGLAGPAELLAQLGDRAVFDRLIDEVTVGETYFFRDVSHFDFAAQTVVPDVLARRGPGHTVRAWSAGCATGEEAYSLAMLLSELGLGERSRVLATDISRAALARARRGRYRNWSLRGPGAERARRWMTREGEEWAVPTALGARVDFEILNLARDQYPGLGSATWAMDVLFCRNVLIYFAAETIREVVARLAASLAEGGALVLGPSDPPILEPESLALSACAPGIYLRRTQGHRPTTAALPLGSPTARSAEAPTAPAGPTTALPARSPATPPPSRTQVPPPSAGAVQPLADVAQAAGAVRSLARSDERGALVACVAALLRFPLSAELHYLHAVLLAARSQTALALAAARRALYLDSSLILGHFVLGAVLWRAGDTAAARRAFSSAARLAAARPSDEPVPLGDGERAGRLAEVARAHALLLDGGARAGARIASEPSEAP